MLQEPLRAVIYTRVSTAEQDSARQLADLRAFAARSGYSIVGEYDETASGTKNDRPERAKVLQLARERKIDVILVTELTRWGRSTQDLLSTLEDLATKKVSLKCQTGMDFDLSTAQGKLMLTLMAGFSQFERDLLKERTLSGIEQARRSGKHCGRPPLDKDLETVIGRHLDDGKPYREIAKILNVSPTTVNKVAKRRKA